MNLFPKTIRDYTAYREQALRAPASRRRVRLLLQHRHVREGGPQGPPKTLAQLSAYAKQLTVKNGDGSIKFLGFNPLMAGTRTRRATGGL